MFAIELSMEKRINFFLSAWFSDLPAINATSFSWVWEQAMCQPTTLDDLLFFFSFQVSNTTTKKSPVIV